MGLNHERDATMKHTDEITMKPFTVQTHTGRTSKPVTVMAVSARDARRRVRVLLRSTNPGIGPATVSSKPRPEPATGGNR